MSLEKELEGVIASGDVSPSDSTDDVTDASAKADAISDGADDLDTQVGDDATDTDGADGDTPARPVENVRREVLRKLSESERRTQTQLEQLGDLIKTMLGGVTAAVGKKPAQTFDDLSLDELRGMRGQVPDDQKTAFESYFEDRRISEAITKKVTQVSEAEKYKAERTKSNQIAVDRYPQLGNRVSEMYKEVNRRLVALDENHRKYNPRIILNLADDVAGELGVTPRQTNRSRGATPPASVRGGKPVARQESGESVIASEAEYEAIAKRLAPALKRSTADPKTRKERILKRGQEYHQHLYGSKE